MQADTLTRTPDASGRPEPPDFILVRVDELRRLTALGRANYESIAEGEGGKRPLRLADALADGLARLERAAATGDRP